MKQEDEDKLLSEIRQILDKELYAYGGPAPFIDGKTMATESLIKLFEEREQASKWIPVSERLPEKGSWVFGFSLKRGAMDLFLDSSDPVIWLSMEGDLPENEIITHWLPKSVLGTPNPTNSDGEAGIAILKEEVKP
jgi:hypothetical protein